MAEMVDSSSADISDMDSSSSDNEMTEFGHMGYMYEPEYTVAELEEEENRLLEYQRAVEDNPRRHDTSWCHCTKCVCMPLLSESSCCHDFDLIEEHFEPGECITEKDNFQMVCLNHVVLATAYVSFLRYKRHRGRAPDILTNRQNRLMAYRQFICWIRRGQPLGRRNRIPLPACVVNRIRTEFPAVDREEYEGFHQYYSDSDSD